MKRYAIVFGGIASLLVLLHGAIVFAIMGVDFKNMSPREFQTIEILGYARYLILLLGVFMGMRSYAKESTTRVSYVSVLKIGLVISIVVALVIGVAEYLFMRMNPNFMQEYSEGMRNMLRQQGATPEMMQRSAEEMQRFSFMMNPAVTGVFYFVETFLIGGAFAVICAFFLRSRVKAEVTMA